MESLVSTKLTSVPKVRKRRYVVCIVFVGLFLCSVFIVSFRMLSDKQFDGVNLELLGEWVGPNGNSITFRRDGTAVGKESDNTSIGKYRWSVADEILAFDRIRNEQGFKKLVRKAVKELSYGSDDEYEITNLTRDTLTILDLQTNRISSFKRSEDLISPSQE